MKTPLFLAAIPLLALSVFADPTAPAAAPAETVPKTGIEVMKLVLCRELKDREPGEAVTQAKVGETVIGWTQVRSGVGDVTITHRWQLAGKTMSDVPLVVKGSPYRTWSRKTMSEPGQWTLQIVNPDGHVLQEASLTVVP